MKKINNMSQKSNNLIEKEHQIKKAAKATFFQFI
jgi:hypothetical protein